MEEMNVYMMWILFLVAAIAYATNSYDKVSPVYRNELRHLPEKLKQERIWETINNTFTVIQAQVMHTAIRNEHELNFTLFCREPNHMSHLFRKKGSTYRLLDPDDSDYVYLTSHNYQVSHYPDDPMKLKPRCSLKDGYELYNRFGYAQPYASGHPYYVSLDNTALQKHHLVTQIQGIPFQHLEQEPILYVQQFFQLFNQHFPDLTLVISHDRKMSEGIFETDCCPNYRVSW